jgi:murein DD-endopeptidase MepM/ murein hydrolase activator NlpD
MLVGGGPAGPWARPVEGAVATSGFGVRIHPVTGERNSHNGQDLSAACGTPIKAVADGVVIFASRDVGGYGQYIVIDHGGGFHTGYGNQQAMHVTAGQQVRRGQHIADVGTEGTSTSCHLHFNTLTGAVNDPWSGNYVDPRPLLVRHGVDYWGG